MGIFSHNIYENIRTRVIVLHAGKILLIKGRADDNWRCPGGGLEPGESLAECAAREVLEETGLRVAIGRVAFLREWVAPTYCQPPEQGGPHGFGLEVFFYATPLALAPLVAEPADQPPEWHPLAAVPDLRLWPIELKSLARHLAQQPQPVGVFSFVTDFWPSDTPATPYDWAGFTLQRED